MFVLSKRIFLRSKYYANVQGASHHRSVRSNSKGEQCSLLGCRSTLFGSLVIGMHHIFSLYEDTGYGCYMCLHRQCRF
jgi:hypothetical protein